MKKFLDGFSKVVEVLCVIIMCLMVLVVFFATVGRYSKLYALSWSDEFARYGMAGVQTGRALCGGDRPDDLPEASGKGNLGTRRPPG